jgi:protein O-GlcNAc transferase
MNATKLSAFLERSLTETVAENETFERASAALRAGAVQEAAVLFEKVLYAQPKHVAALNLLSIALIRLGRFADAESYLRTAIDEYPNSDATLYNYGIILKALNRPAEAVERFTQALTVNPAATQTWQARGLTLSELNRHESAIEDFDKVIALSPHFAEAFYYKAKSLALLRRFDEASAAFEKTLALRPDLAEAWCGLGNIQYRLRQYDKALDVFDKALAVKPALAEAWLGRGNILFLQKRYDETLAAYNKALAIKPDIAEAWVGRGNLLLQLKRHDDASTSYDKALALNPDLAVAWHGRGNVFWELRRYDDAFAAYDKALALMPDLNCAACSRLVSKLRLCDWTNLEAEAAQLLSMNAPQQVSDPALILTIPSSSADQLQCATRYVQNQPSPPQIWRGEIYAHNRVRVAYLSADFHEHPVAFLTVGLFEQHDRSRFEVTGISVGPDENSALRGRIKGAFERYLDARTKSDQEIADLMRRLEIDIAVDLMGFTQDNRFNVFAARPAPIQVSYLGYPGTMGASCIDYIVADSTIIPENKRKFYTEKVVWLPGSYQANDSRRHVSAHTPTRRDCGLPEDAFVFCCFNNAFKLAPDTFRIWMNVLKAVDNSVLWLSDTNSTAKENLRRECERYGVSRQRLIFAPKLPNHADHLARNRLADLFLDTLPYNAHTTASEALWAGLPVLTQIGETFVGRVAASLLQAIGLSELITTSAKAYEELAIELATNPEKLAAIKRRLAANRHTASLFDTKLFARRIEAAYEAIYQRHQAGLSPDHIHVVS